MSALLKITTIVFITIISISCSKDDDAQAPQVVVQTNLLSASIDGVSYSANGSNVVVNAVTSSPTKITITSTLPTGIFQFVLDNHVGVGNYTVNGIGGYTLVMKFVSANSSDPYATNTCGEDEGTLIITKLTTSEIEGTFSFIGKQTGNCEPSDGKIFTNGSFKSLITL